MKRIFLIILAAVLMLTTCVSCNKDSNNKSADTDKKTQAKVSSSNKTGDKSEASSDAASSGTSSSSSSNGTSSQLSSAENKNYGGKTFTMCVWEAPTEAIKSKVTAFNKKYNANVEIKVVTDFYEDVPKSISSGKPFDIVSYSPTFYSSKFMENNFEPLNSHITASDYSNDKGINKTATEMFTYKGNIYSAVSSRSVLPYVIYYNKALSKQKYGRVNPHDPYTIWKSGNWNFEKMKQLSHAELNSAALAYTELSVWLNIRGVSAISRNGDAFSTALKTANVSDALNSYKDMFYGSSPMMSKSVVDFNARASSSPSVYKIGTVEDYEVYLQGSKNAAVDNLKTDNLGVVPLPEGMYPNGKYPAQISRAYSAAKGASDPSVAVYYALFEGDFEYTSCANTVPKEIYNAVYSEFNKGGFIGYNSGYPTKSNSGILSGTTCIKQAGRLISNGVPVDQAVNQFNDLLTKAINYNP